MLPQPGELRPAWAGRGSASFCGASPSSTPFLPFTFHSPRPLLSLPLLLFPLLLFSRSSSAPSPAGANTQKQPRSALGGSEEVVPHVALGVIMGALGMTVRAAGAILRVPGRSWERFPCQYCSYWEHWERTGRKQSLDAAAAGGGGARAEGVVMQIQERRALSLVGGSSGGLPRSRECWRGLERWRRRLVRGERIGNGDREREWGQGMGTGIGNGDRDREWGQGMGTGNGNGDRDREWGQGLGTGTGNGDRDPVR